MCRRISMISLLLVSEGWGVLGGGWPSVEKSERRNPVSARCSNCPVKNDRNACGWRMILRDENWSHMPHALKGVPVSSYVGWCLQQWGVVVMRRLSSWRGCLRSWSSSLLFRTPCCGAMGGDRQSFLLPRLVQRTDSYVHCVPARMWKVRCS